MSAQPTIASLYDAALLDLDGTIYEGGDPVRYALESLTEANLRNMFVTNNASRAPQTVADQLQSLGYNCVADDVVTSAQAAIEIAGEEIEPGSAVYVLGAQSFKDLAVAAGYRVVDSADDAPAAVLHGLNREMTWAQISEAALAISRGAKYLVSNMDTTLPSERGYLVGNGSVAAAITTTTGVVPRSAGKPLPPMFHVAAQHAGATKPLAIGDRLDTDIEGGNAAGYDTFLVLTGVSTHLDVVNAAKALRPTYVSADMRGLNGPAVDCQFAAAAGLHASRSSADPSVIILDGGDANCSLLAEPESAAAAALRTVASFVWAEEAAEVREDANSLDDVTSPENPISGVEAASDAARQALAAWRS